MKALYAPDAVPYYATFGLFRLCLNTSSGSAVLEQIDYDAPIPPLSTVPTLRTVPDESERDGPWQAWTPLGGVLGRPGEFAFGEARGTFTTQVAGFEVDLTCAEIRDPERRFIELLNVLHVSGDGAQVDDFTIRYTFQDESYELVVPWQMIGCGRMLPDDLCLPPQE